MPELLLTRRAKQDLGALPPAIREAIVETLTLIEAEPEIAGKQLRGRLRGLWSSRVGNYRVLYTIEGTTRKQRIIVRAIRHRAAAYRHRHRR